MVTFEPVRYLTVNGDYRGTGVSDDFAGPVTPAELGLEAALVTDITRWVEDYQLAIADRVSVKAQAVEDLDARGVNLARRIAGVLGNDTKVRYYSDATGRHTLL